MALDSEAINCSGIRFKSVLNCKNKQNTSREEKQKDRIRRMCCWKCVPKDGGVYKTFVRRHRQEKWQNLLRLVKADAERLLYY